MTKSRVQGSALAILLACAAALAGCPQTPGIHDPNSVISAPAQSVSIYQLARRLDLRVLKAGPVSASLTNKANSVTVFSDPGGGVFVNGRRLSHVGAIESAAGVIFVPLEVEPAILASLRPLPPQVEEPVVEEPVRPSPKFIGRVVVDAGHGGKDPGAIGKGGLYEKHVALRVARDVRRRLAEAGVKVIMTRSDDTFVELEERAAIANRARADLFVSIHADSADNGAAQGHTLYVARAAAAASLAAAGQIDECLTAMNGGSRGVRRANYRVLVKTACPSVLVEVGYLSNHVEARKLADGGHCGDLAEAISTGILNYLRR